VGEKPCRQAACDSSKNRRATKGYHGSGHLIVASFEPGEDRRWCSADGALSSSLALSPVGPWGSENSGRGLLPPSGGPTQAGATQGLSFRAVVGQGGEVEDKHDTLVSRKRAACGAREITEAGASYAS
jgi:hypothetical protein